MSGKKARQARKAQEPQALRQRRDAFYIGDAGEAGSVRNATDITDRMPLRYREITEAVAKDDQEWFEAHPHAEARIRPYVAGECAEDADDPQYQFTLVRQIAPGIRVRSVVDSEFEPLTMLHMNPDTGEVLGKYSEAESYSDELVQRLRAIVGKKQGAPDNA